MSNICAGIGRGQITIVDEHIAHHRHVQSLYEELLKNVKGSTMHTNPGPDYDYNFWLCTATLDPDLKIKGQENAYKQVITGAVGGVAGVTHTVATATTDCQPNDNVEALRMALEAANIESLFKVGICLPADPCVTDDHVHYIMDEIKKAIDF